MPNHPPLPPAAVVARALGAHPRTIQHAWRGRSPLPLDRFLDLVEVYGLDDATAMAWARDLAGRRRAFGEATG